jgi:flagellar biosynthesis/type III secretory pathway protein FliH
MGMIGLALTSLILPACASRHAPLAHAKLSQAERAFDEAQQAGAAINAPYELKAADDKLKDARAAAAKKDYHEAIRTAEQAVVDADYARARAVHHRVKTLADEMRQGLGALRKELER